MLFNSLSFAIFFPIVSLLFFVLPHRFRWAMLLAASCIFYMYFIPIYILILVFTILVDYVAGIWIERSTGARRRMLLGASIVANVGVLGVFKYFNFANANIAALAQFIGWNYPISALTLILPVGLSFHTFQAMSYTIEVYRGNQKAERHLGIYALYVMFYPQLVAGPIERPQNLLHQFHEVHRFDYDCAVSGLQLMLWGTFKKVVIADRLATRVNLVFARPDMYDAPVLMLATICFAWQIYCDFSGYSYIAIGSARFMGFRLMRNFDRPYMARSVAEFWRRWHISLSTWFKDYVYIPLGGNRVGRLIWTRNILVVFVLSGLWHGANWTFVVWGALHGLYIAFGAATKDMRERLWQLPPLASIAGMRPVVQNVITVTLVCIAWVFFRASSVETAVYIIRHMFTGWGPVLANIAHGKVPVALSPSQVLPYLFVIVLLEWIQWTHARRTLPQRLRQRPVWMRWSVYYAAIGAIVFLGTAGGQFIYFQF
jgi:D-alanyl-lipoteichoic acid acyltransferase DltB (MBOAT superfamily)